MKRKGFAPIIVSICLVAVVALGVVWYVLYGPTSNYKLQDSEVSNLVTWLKANSLQAAIIEKIYPPNGGSVWVVKSDGSEQFLYKKDLGYDGWGQANYQELLENNYAKGFMMIPDQAEFFDADPSTGENYYSDDRNGKVIDISSYITGHSVDPFWRHGFAPGGFAHKVNAPVEPYLSPDGRYLISFNQDLSAEVVSASGTVETTYFYELSKIFKDGEGVSSTPITLLPGTNWIWSKDGNDILMQTSDFKDIGVYDIANQSTTYLLENGYIKIMHSGTVATGTLVSDSEGNLEIKKADGVTVRTWQLPDKAVVGAIFPQSSSIPKDIKLIGWVN